MGDYVREAKKKKKKGKRENVKYTHIYKKVTVKRVQYTENRFI